MASSLFDLEELRNCLSEMKYPEQQRRVPVGSILVSDVNKYIMENCAFSKNRAQTTAYNAQLSTNDSTKTPDKPDNIIETHHFLFIYAPGRYTVIEQMDPDSGFKRTRVLTTEEDDKKRTEEIDNFCSKTFPSEYFNIQKRARVENDKEIFSSISEFFLGDDEPVKASDARQAVIVFIGHGSEAGFQVYDGGVIDLNEIIVHVWKCWSTCKKKFKSKKGKLPKMAQIIFTQCYGHTYDQADCDNMEIHRLTSEGQCLSMSRLDENNKFYIVGLETVAAKIRNTMRKLGNETPIEEQEQNLVTTVPTTGIIQHEFYEDDTIWSVTTLGNLIFILRNTYTDQVNVYDAENFYHVRQINVPGLSGPQDIVACHANGCLYVSDDQNNAIHKIDSNTGRVVHNWSAEAPRGLSISNDPTVVATCSAARKIVEYSLDGNEEHSVMLPEDATNPRHAIKKDSDQYVVCHGWHDKIHRVMIVDRWNGKKIWSYGGKPSEFITDLCVPTHLQVSRRGRLHLVDRHNKRILLMTSLQLRSIRHIVHTCEWYPVAISLDEDRGRLLIAEREVEDFGKKSRCRVTVLQHRCKTDDTSPMELVMALSPENYDNAVD